MNTKGLVDITKCILDYPRGKNKKCHEMSLQTEVKVRPLKKKEYSSIKHKPYTKYSSSLPEWELMNSQKMVFEKASLKKG